MRLLGNAAIVLVALFANGMHASPVFAMRGQADAAFAFRVCKLLDQPFSGSVTSGGADGCEWGLSDSDGVTIESEKIRSTATSALSKEDLQSLFDTQLTAYQAGAKSGAFKLEALQFCEGGWQVSSDLRPGHPVHAGFYRCNHRLVNVDTEGAKSVRQFDLLAGKMVDLVK